MVHIVNRLI